MYVHVENGAITAGPMQLPEVWRNVSGLHLAPQDFLAELGWLPYEATPLPPHDQRTQKVVTRVEIGATAAREVHRVVNRTRAEIQAYDDEQKLLLASERASKKIEVAARRWQAQQAGIVFKGTRFPTDPASVSAYTSNAFAATQDPSLTVKWKLPNGVFVVLNSDQVIRLASAARAHVQACFDREAELAAAIDAAATIAAVEGLDITGGWPDIAA